MRQDKPRHEPQFQVVRCEMGGRVWQVVSNGGMRIHEQFKDRRDADANCAERNGGPSPVSRRAAYITLLKEFENSVIHNDCTMSAEEVAVRLLAMDNQ